MAPRVHLLLRAAVVVLLGWQGARFATREYHHVVEMSAIGADLRFSADTATRVRRVLGADADVHDLLRTVVPAGTTVVNRAVQGPPIDLEHVRALEARRAAGDEAALRELVELQTTFERLSARNGLFVQLNALLYPAPVFVSVPDPTAAVEDGALRDAWLFVLDGDPEPAGRVGWQRSYASSRFQLWRFQKG